jgi:hypothetical protein
LLAALKQQYGSFEELGRIVSQKHTKRHVELIQEIERSIVKVETSESQGNSESGPLMMSMDTCCRADTPPCILCGGSRACNIEERFVAPTFVLNPPRKCRMMTEEIFGPLLPIIVYDDKKEAIEWMRSLSTPLCLYVFGSQQAFEEITNLVPSGSTVRNDALVHLASSTLGFGGLGESGFGRYHGKASFDTFSHKRSSLYRPCGPGFDFNLLRCHPFRGVKGKAFGAALRLPYIPVLHARLWLFLLVIFFLLNIYVSGEQLADCLDRLSAWLRSWDK